MRYISTRGQTEPMTFKDAVITGMAPDGGLLVPESLPDLHDRLDDFRGLSFVRFVPGEAEIARILADGDRKAHV